MTACQRQKKTYHYFCEIDYIGVIIEKRIKIYKNFSPLERSVEAHYHQQYETCVTRIIITYTGRNFRNLLHKHI